MRNEQTLDEAIDWFLRLRDGENDLAVRRALTAWLRQSPEHVRAYLEVTAMWVNVPSMGTERIGDAQALIERARLDDNVEELVLPVRRSPPPPTGASPHWSTPPSSSTSSSLGAPVPESSSSSSGRSRARRLLLAVAASFIVASVVVTGVWLTFHRQPTYATDIGEQRSITLADRSRIELNSQSKVRIRFNDRERTVDLLAGQALFRVAKDPGRPFVVRSDTARVRAIGTTFDVYRKSGGTVVTVVEGKVRVEGAATPAASFDVTSTESGANSVPAVELTAGEQTIIRGRAETAAPAPPKPVNVAAATAWTGGHLVFESAPLSEVVEEFNRHNTRQLVLRDGAGGDVRISAVFPSTDPGPLVQFLRAQPNLLIQESEREITVARK